MRKILVCLAVLLCLGSINAESLKVMYFASPNNEAVMKELKESYEKAYPGNKIELMAIQTNTGTAEGSKTVMVLKDKNAGVDVARLHIETLDMLAAGKSISPIPELDGWKEWKNFYPALQEKMKYENKYYGIPYATNARILFYNKDLFKKAGIPVPWIPKSWQDIIDAARAIKKTSPDVIPFWLKLGTAQGVELLLYGTDDRYMENGKWVVESQGILDTFKLMQLIMKEGLTDHISKLISKEAGNYVEKEYIPEGKVGIVLTGAWIMRDWTGDKSYIMDTYLRAPLPTQYGQGKGHITLSDGQFFALTTFTKKREAALEFMKFASSKEGVMTNAKIMGDLSSRLDVLEMDDYPDNLKEVTPYLEFTEFNPSSPEYFSVALGLNDAMNMVAIGHQTPEEAMKSFANNMEFELGKDKIVRKEYKK